MWPRVVEVMLGFWLALSPFIFGHSGAELAFWVADFAAALSIWTFSLLSFWEKTRRAQLGNLVVALALGAFAYVTTGSPAPAAAQNELMIAMLLGMMAIIPSHASAPPKAWLEYYAAERAS
jgi:hypothetical protein